MQYENEYDRTTTPLRATKYPSRASMGLVPGSDSSKEQHPGSICGGVVFAVTRRVRQPRHSDLHSDDAQSWPRSPWPFFSGAVLTLRRRFSLQPSGSPRSSMSA
jgi:hypothetical protein